MKTNPVALSAAVGKGPGTEPEVAGRKVLQPECEGSDCMSLPRSHISEMFRRVHKISEQIDEAFAYEMFLPNQNPDSAANRIRSTAYLRAQMQNAELLHKALELWLLSFGVKP